MQHRYNIIIVYLVLLYVHSDAWISLLAGAGKPCVWERCSQPRGRIGGWSSLSKKYLDTSAFVLGVPGCVEHYQTLLAIIGDTYKWHCSQTVCWLDLANAYGNVRHRLITYCLKHYHAPQTVSLTSTLISVSYNHFQSLEHSTSPPETICVSRWPTFTNHFQHSYVNLSWYPEVIWAPYIHSVRQFY